MKAGSLLFLFIWCLVSQAHAQPGRIAIGTRGSLDGAGVNGKYFFRNGFALEGQLNAGGIRLLNGHSAYGVALIEYHLQLPLPAFRLYFGGGVHGGVWNGRDETPFPEEVMAGLSGIAGFEYIFRRFPMGISGDLRPSINYVREVEFFPHNLIGISLRYYFGSNKVKPFEYPPRVRSRFK